MTPQSPFTLHRGEAFSVLRSLDDTCVDAVITDPPYCSGAATITARKRDTNTKYLKGPPGKFQNFEGDFRDQRSFTLWATYWLSECYRVTRAGGLLMTFIDWRMLPSMTDAVQAAGWTWRGLVVWDKTPGVRPQLGYFRSQAEYVVFASKGNINTKAHPVVLDGVYTLYSRPAEKLHQVGKPLALMEKLIKIVPPHSTVLDPFAGSATTGVAALRAGHQFIGIEMVPGYYEISLDRLRTEIARVS